VTSIRPRRPGAAALVLVLAILALAATVAARPPHAPPLYDGLGFPDEPYRWVVAPAGSAPTASATAAVVTVHVSAGATAPAQALSAEQGPQVAVAVESRAFPAPGGAGSISLRAQPRAAPPTPPDGGQVVSNLYDLSATAAGRPVPLAAGHNVLVNLRAESATDQAVVICRWTGRRWEQVPTEQVGADIYAARLDVLGPVAVVRLDPGVRPTVGAIAKGSGSGAAAPVAAAVGAPGAAAGAAPGGGPGGNALLLVLGGLVVVLATGLLLVRRRSRGA
jgi:hypothetical protein